MDGRRFLFHHGLKVEKARKFAAEVFGEGLVGFRFNGTETEVKGEGQTAAKGESQAAQGKAARTGKRKVTATA